MEAFEINGHTVNISFIIWFYGALIQFRSYGAETGKLISAFSGCYKLKATLGTKTISPAEARRCIDSRKSDPFSHAGINSGCNSHASILEGKPSSTWDYKRKCLSTLFYKTMHLCKSKVVVLSLVLLYGHMSVSKESSC
jgi:hypothetical protein